LATIRGTLSSTHWIAARKSTTKRRVRRQTLPHAQIPCDVSHMVYIAMEHDGHAKPKGAGEFSIMDLWSSMEGLNSFFVTRSSRRWRQRIFRDRDPFVWAPAKA